MLSQKCRICGERHPLGPCPTPRRGGATVVGSADHANGDEPSRDTSSASQTKAVRGGVTAGETAPSFEGKGTIAPKGVCEWCDRRRELNKAVAQARRDRVKHG